MHSNKTELPWCVLQMGTTYKYHTKTKLLTLFLKVGITYTFTHRAATCKHMIVSTLK